MRRVADIPRVRGAHSNNDAKTEQPQLARRVAPPEPSFFVLYDEEARRFVRQPGVSTASIPSLARRYKKDVALSTGSLMNVGREDRPQVVVREYRGEDLVATHAAPTCPVELELGVLDLPPWPWRPKTA